MTDLPLRTNYSRVAIALHWIVALALIANLAGGLLADSIDKADKPAWMALHKATGITILALTLAQVAWRLGHKPPPLAPTVLAWEVVLSRVVHWGFYLLAIAVPLSGWTMVSAGARKFAIGWYGLFDVPFLPVAQGKALAGGAKETHELLAFAMIGLALIHILAALKHHFWDRDDTVMRILPLLRRPVD